MRYQIAIVIVFVVMFVVGIVGVILTHRLTPYMNSPSWRVKKWSFAGLALIQAHGIAKTCWTDHHFNLHDVVFFAELTVVFIGLDLSYYLMLKSWRQFPMFKEFMERARDQKRS